MTDIGKYSQDAGVIREFESNMYRMAGEIIRLRAALAKSDPIRRIYDEGIPVLVCIHCGGERGRFENEVQHTQDCIWKMAGGTNE